MHVGVLALQGGYAAHMAALANVGFHSREVRTPEDIKGLDGVVLPGGESTTQIKLLKRYGPWLRSTRSFAMAVSQQPVQA